MSDTPRTDLETLSHLTHNGQPTVVASLARDLERELNTVKANYHALRTFCETEMNWEFFRAEYEIKGCSASAENARKLQAFLNRL